MFVFRDRFRFNINYSKIMVSSNILKRVKWLKQYNTKSVNNL